MDADIHQGLRGLIRLSGWSVKNAVGNPMAQYYHSYRVWRCVIFMNAEREEGEGEGKETCLFFRLISHIASSLALASPAAASMEMSDTPCRRGACVFWHGAISQITEVINKYEAERNKQINK